MEEACDECTQNCLMMHKKLKEPSYVDTFFKVMFGDDFSKVLILPPKFAQRVSQQMVGKSTELEDSSGEKWRVNFKTIDGSLAFENGWNKFATDHQLKIGDFLVFHYIKKSHFVVLMYGQSGCPELRHQMRGTQEHNNMITDDCSPLNVNHQSEHSQQMEKKLSKKKKKSGTLATNESPKNSNHLVASLARPDKSSSDKETGQISDPLVENTNRDETMVPETPPVTSGLDKETGQISDPLAENTTRDETMVPVTSGSDKETGQISDPLVENTTRDETMVPETPPVTSGLVKEATERSEPLVIDTNTNLGQFCLVDNDNGNIDECRKTNLERSESLVSKTVINLVDNDDGNIEDECRITNQKINSDRSDGGRKNDVAAGGGGRRDNVAAGGGGGNETGDNEFRKMIEKRVQVAGEKRKEIPSETTCNNNSNKKRLSNTDDSRNKLKDNKTDYNDSPMLKQVKPEPFDLDEAPPPGSTNASFSAVMTSYKYLELPDWVKMKFGVSGCGVILLKNRVDFWPVFYQKKSGVQGLTQGWGAFAKVKGIKLGDKCEFLQISQAISNSSCNMFSINVTR